MFEIFVGAHYDFMKGRRVAYLISGFLCVASIVSLALHGGPKESIDFTGGTLLEVGFSQPTAISDVRASALAAGIDGAEIQMVEGGQDAILHFREDQAPDNAFHALKQSFEAKHAGDEVILRRTETVGPKVGGELEQKATMAILWSLVLILLYIAWRFTRVSFGLAAVIALFHDILITLGMFSLFNIEVSLTVVAAFLTIGGYSINDTIIVFDRIRENMGLIRRKSFPEVINISVNQTLSRTVLTAGTTLVAVLALYFLGGVVIHDFAFAMMIGIIVGTYSSIYVASALALDISNWWNRRKERREAEGKSRPRAVTAG